MAHYFYIDNDGRKQGPIHDRQLKDMVTQGAITPNTPLETDTGHKGKAGQISGLFDDATIPPVLPPRMTPSKTNETVESDSDRQPAVRFKTRELNFWKKLMQMYWVIPKSILLDEFAVENEHVFIKVMSGKSLSAPLMELKIRSEKDKYERRRVHVCHGDQKLCFFEVPWMLEDEEWETVFNILDTVPDKGLTKMGVMVEFLKGIKTTLGFMK